MFIKVASDNILYPIISLALSDEVVLPDLVLAQVLIRLLNHDQRFFFSMRIYQDYTYQIPHILVYMYNVHTIHI